MPALRPAPGSTATSAPSPIIFLTVSGVAATRGSPESVSAATAIFMESSDGGRNGRSDQEVRHQDNNHDDYGNSHLGQVDEGPIRLLMRGIIVAVRSRILRLTMV